MSGIAYQVVNSGGAVVDGCTNAGSISVPKGKVSGIIDNCEVDITDCKTTEDALLLNYGTTGNSGRVCGIVNYAYASVINCDNAATLAGHALYGVVADLGPIQNTASTLQLKYCTNSGDFQTRSNGTASMVAGTVGSTSYTASIIVTECSNEADITFDGSIEGVLGTVGNKGSVIITGCYNKGNLTAGNKSAVGVVDSAFASSASATGISIENCYNEGAISASGSSTGVCSGVIGTLGSPISSFRGPIKVQGCYNKETGVITSNGNF